jgi:hypothetical protein
MGWAWVGFVHSKMSAALSVVKTPENEMKVGSYYSVECFLV